MALVNYRYELEERLGKGGMGEVYRAVDRLSGDKVALKRVLVKPNQLLFASGNETTELKIALAREFKVLASLRHPNIIEVLDYGFDQERQPFFTMTLLDSAQSILDVAQPMHPNEKVALVVDVLQALKYLHRRGILHRDIKPSNVLVTNEHIYLVDFGLAVDQSRAQGVVGTLAYLAPEIFTDKKASVESDLYSIGVLLYHCLTGNVPFETSDMQRFMDDLLQRRPDLSLISTTPDLRDEQFWDDEPTTNLEDDPTVLISDEESTQARQPYVPPLTPETEPSPDFPLPAGTLVAVVGRLLEKEPRERYHSATEATIALCEAAGLALPAETREIRESFIQAATFVGRKAERQQLADALETLMDERSGSAWLVGGESGVGKSRLVDEMRIEALVKGATVVRGQAIESGGLPYQLWRDVMPHLILPMELDDLEAGILKEIVPNIEQLLKRSIPEAPDLTGTARQDRLILTMTEVMRRQERPVVVILEDLQWSQESLVPLIHILSMISTLPLMVIGTFRSEERPDLPVQLPAMQTMHLSRLNQADIADLSASMLGRAGRLPEFVSYLEHETEGNVFFLVEVVRVLAEETGNLSDIAHIDLPPNVLSEGIKTIVERRLRRVPNDYHEILYLAAVVGRQLDLAILKNCFETQIDVDGFIDVCANAAIFAFEDERWRFAHAKLREGLVNKLSERDRTEYHARVATAIEHSYPDELDDYAEELMLHWQQAQQADKEMVYLLQVAEQLIRVKANYERSTELLHHAQSILEDTPMPEHDGAIHRLLGFAYENQGLYDQAVAHYKQSLNIAQERKDQRLVAECYSRLGNTIRLQGDYDRATELLEQSITILTDLGDISETARPLANLAAVASVQGNFDKALEYSKRSAALATEHGDLFSSGVLQGNMGVISAITGDLDDALKYFQRSLDISRQIGDQRGTAIGLNNLGALARLREDYEGVRTHCEESLAISRRIGDRYTATKALHEMVMSSLKVGNMLDAEQYLADGMQTALVSNALPAVLLMGSGAVHLFMQRGQYEIAAEWVGAMLDHPAIEQETLDILHEARETLKKQLNATNFQGAMARGQVLDVEEMAQDLLATLPTPTDHSV